MKNGIAFPFFLEEHWPWIGFPHFDFTFSLFVGCSDTRFGSPGHSIFALELGK